MERNYRAFMDKQHPSEDLLAQTISKAKKLAEETQESKRTEASGNGDFIPKTDNVLKRSKRKWKCGIAVFAVLCLTAGLWYWNTQLNIVYMDLVTEFSPDEGSEYENKREEEFGEERNSYLNFEPSYFYVFDKDAERMEVKVSKGSIMVQTGIVKIAGNQLLYQIKPQRLKGTEVFLGKIGSGEEKHLYAAFDLEDIHYYLEGENVTEKEMTSYIKDLIKDYGERK